MLYHGFCKKCENPFCSWVYNRKYCDKHKTKNKMKCPKCNDYFTTRLGFRRIYHPKRGLLVCPKCYAEYVETVKSIKIKMGY